jgi:hypothetical protein
MILNVVYSSLAEMHASGDSEALPPPAVRSFLRLAIA